jgi:hypothetical protein
MLSPQSLCPGLAKKTIGWGEAPQPAWPGRRFPAADAGPHAAPSLCPSSRVISTHFDRVAFKVVRIYATLAADGRTANLKFTPDEQEFRCMMAPEAFAPVPNAWGKQGWTTANLSKLSTAELTNALETAWAHAVQKRRRRR